MLPRLFSLTEKDTVDVVHHKKMIISGLIEFFLIFNQVKGILMQFVAGRVPDRFFHFS